MGRSWSAERLEGYFTGSEFEAPARTFCISFCLGASTGSGRHAVSAHHLGLRGATAALGGRSAGLSSGRGADPGPDFQPPSSGRSRRTKGQGPQTAPERRRRPIGQRSGMRPGPFFLSFRCIVARFGQRRVCYSSLKVTFCSFGTPYKQSSQANKPQWATQPRMPMHVLVCRTAPPGRRFFQPRVAQKIQAALQARLCQCLWP